MAKKNFSQMTTKKLNALLATASDDDKAAITQELNARAAIAAEPASDHTVGGAESNDVIIGDELTPEEQAQVDAAEANGGKVAKAPRLSEEERTALVNQLKSEVVGHKCQVLPMGKAEWADGVITGIMNDKRANNIMLNIKLADGRVVRKMHNAETLRVLDETVELVGAKRGRVAGEPKAETPWDTMEDEIATASEHVGKVASLEGVELGRIMTIVPDKRVKKLLYRIVVPGTETEPAKTLHKVVSAPLTYADFDEDGKKIHDDFVARREKIANKAPLTLEERIAQAELDLQKANERLVAAQAKVKATEELIAKLRTEAESIVAQADGVPAEAAPEADELA